jgi:hypothetical protein
MPRKGVAVYHTTSLERVHTIHRSMFSISQAAHSLTYGEVNRLIFTPSDRERARNLPSYPLGKRQSVHQGNYGHVGKDNCHLPGMKGNNNKVLAFWWKIDKTWEYHSLLYRSTWIQKIVTNLNWLRVSDSGVETVRSSVKGNSQILKCNVLQLV